MPAVIVVVPSPVTTDLFQFVVTSTPEQVGEVGQVFVDMIAMFRFT